jgi:hypothetical protein
MHTDSACQTKTQTVDLSEFFVSIYCQLAAEGKVITIQIWNVLKDPYTLVILSCHTE